MTDHPYGHWMIFGDSGAGKSTSAATFPKPMLVFAFDPLGKEMPYLKRGVPSLTMTADKTMLHEVKSARSGELLIAIEHYIDSDPTAPTAYARFRRRLGTLEGDIAQFGFKTIVVDSVTFMEIAARKEAQYVLNPHSKEPRQWFASSTDSLEEVLMIRFGALPLNVVVCAHIDEEKDEVHGTFLRTPAAPGRLRRRSPAGFSEVYRAYVRRLADGTPEHLWQTRSDVIYNCASQVDAPDPCPQDYHIIWQNEKPR